MMAQLERIYTPFGVLFLLVVTANFAPAKKRKKR